MIIAHVLRLLFRFVAASLCNTIVVAGTPTIPAGAVVEQYVWSPYGELLSRDVFDRRVNPDGSPTPTTGKLVTDAGAARPPNDSDPGSPGTAGASLPGIRNKVGHQGLFFERFDGLNTDRIRCERSARPARP